MDYLIERANELMLRGEMAQAEGDDKLAADLFDKANQFLRFVDVLIAEDQLNR